jgi:hypothetical protein
MPSAKKKSSKPTTCPQCGGVDLVRKITTYPVLLSGPLEGKQVHIGVLRSTNARPADTSCPPLLAKPRSIVMSRWDPPVPRTTTLIGYLTEKLSQDGSKRNREFLNRRWWHAVFAAKMNSASSSHSHHKRK